VRANSIRASGTSRSESSGSTLPTMAHASESSRSSICSMSAVKSDDSAVCSLHGQLFHAMISYRVATEGEAGNGLSMALYREIHRLSVTTCPLPLGAYGQWPTFARPAEFRLEGQAKVYLDVCCLIDGEPWERGATGRGGFIGGVSSAIVFVPLLSWYSDGGGFVGRMSALDSSQGRDWVDNCLLEMIVALELQQIPGARLSAICPIYVGAKDQSGLFGAFPFEKISTLSENPSYETNKRAIEILALLGFLDKLVPGDNCASGAERVMAQGVQHVVSRIGKNQGVQLVTEGISSKAIASAATRVLGVVNDKVKQMGRASARHQLVLDKFLLGRPQAYEVHDWLVANRLTKYASVFAAHGIDSLRLMAHLATHTTALDEIHQETAVHMAEESNCAPKLLWGDLNRLRDRVSRLGDDDKELLQERWEKFKDTESSTLAGTFTTQGPEAALGVRFFQINFLTIFANIAETFFNATNRRPDQYDPEQIIWRPDGISYGSIELRYGLIYNDIQNVIHAIIMLLLLWRG